MSKSYCGLISEVQPQTTMNVFASLLLLASVSSAFSFKVDLSSGIITGTPPAWVKWHQELYGSGTCAKRGTLEIDMTGRTNVTFVFTFQPITNGWLMNIGDSSTNDGDGGDDYTQERNCEAQVYGSEFAVFKNQRQPGQAFSSSWSPGWSVDQDLSVIVRNGYISWDNLAGETGFLSNPNYYYALGNQLDAIGDANKVIYLGMNQVVKGGTSTGTGLCSVDITFDVV